MQKLRPYVLCIGGFDPSGGAGVLADIKTLEHVKVMGLSVLTCNTLQTDKELVTLDWFQTDDMVRAIRKLMKTYPIGYVKIGVVRNPAMLGQIVKELLSIRSSCKIIWDTVFGSSSGFDFFEFKNMELLQNVFSKLFLITPNSMEYDVLRQYNLLHDRLSVLKKAGHNPEKIGADVLFTAGEEIEIHNEQVKLPPKHGSGCVLATAITAYLALGNDLETACNLGKDYVLKLLKSNDTLLGYHNE